MPIYCTEAILGGRLGNRTEVLQEPLKSMPWDQDSSAYPDAGDLALFDGLVDRDPAEPEDFRNFAYREHGRVIFAFVHSILRPL